MTLTCRMRAALRQLLPNLTLTFVTTVIVLGVIEFATRLLVERPRVAGDNWIIDKRIGWKQKPNLNVTWHNYGKAITFQTNEDGIQITGDPSAQHRILIVGDSTVVGTGVDQGARIHDRILDHWRQRGGGTLYVMNAGVEGYSTDQSLLMLEALLEKYRPTIVLHAICDNDFLQNASTEAHGLVKPRFGLTNGKLIFEPNSFIGNPASRTGGASELIASLLKSSSLYRVIQPALYSIRQGVGLAPDDLPFYREFFYLNFDLYAAKADWQLFTALVVQMRDLSHVHGSKFFAYKHPSLEEVWLPHRKALGITDQNALSVEHKMQEILSEARVEYISMYERFLGDQAAGPFHLLLRDPHANAKGYDLQAEIIIGRLLAN